MSKNITYRGEIDGLRAVAVVSVIVFHAGVEQLSGGFIGVDVFFVISGFLIYSIILRETEKGSFSFSTFYERRVRRLAPALITVIAATVPLAWVLFDPIQLKDFGQSVFCATFFCANVLFWSEADYFAHSAELKPLLHTWSLSVEEQFYVLFPFLALWLAHVTDRAKGLILSGLLFLSLGIAIRFHVADPSAAFYLLHTRAWELLAGAVCAVAARHTKTPKPGAADLGLLLIIGSLLFVDNDMAIPGLACVPAVLGTCLVLLYGSGQSVSGRVLASPPLVMIGLISYSAYLIHQPLLAFTRLVYAPGPWVLLPVGLLALPLGYLSWRFVEQPFRKHQTGKGFVVSRSALIGCVALPVVIFAGFGIAMHALNGAPQRNTLSGTPWAELNLTEKLGPNYGLDRACSGRDVAAILASEACRTTSKPKVLLWGDSFAMHLAPILTESAIVAEKGLMQITLSQCTPIVGVSRNGSSTTAADCLAFNEAVMKYVEGNTELTHVVLSSPFFIGPGLQDENGNWPPHPRTAATSALQTMLGRIEAAGAVPILVGPTPGNTTNLGRCLSGNVARDLPLSRCDVVEAEIDPRVERAYDLVTAAANGRPFIDLRRALCNGGMCAVSAENDIFLYRDWGHFSNEGARWIGRTAAPFDAILAEPGPDTHANPLR